MSRTITLQVHAILILLTTFLRVGLLQNHAFKKNGTGIYYHYLSAFLHRISKISPHIIFIIKVEKFKNRNVWKKEKKNEEKYQSKDRFYTTPCSVNCLQNG